MSDVLLIPVIVWLSTQAIKGIQFSRVQRSWQWRNFLQSGGMPSSHTATVTSLLLMVGLRDGFDSSIFSVTAVFAGIVAYDALGVRRSSGEQARMINRIISKVFPGKAGVEDLKVVLGHHPNEVMAGVIYGIFVTYTLQYYL